MAALDRQREEGLKRTRTIGPTLQPLIGGQGRRTPVATQVQGIHQQLIGAAVIGETLDQDPCPLDRPRIVPVAEQPLDGLDLSRLGRRGLRRLFRHRGSS
jgi:hypothetical protein